MRKTYNISFGVIGVLTLILLIVFSAPVELYIIFGLFALLYVFNAYFLVRNVNTKKHRISELALKLKEKEHLLQTNVKIEKEIIENMPVGIVVFNAQFDIEWANEFAKKIFENNLVNRNLDMIHHALKEKLQFDDIKRPFVIKIYEYEYEIHHHESMQTFFLYPVSERESIKRDYYKQTPVVGVLHLDNLNETIEVLDVQEENVLRGKYLGALYEWSENYGFYLLPIASSRVIAYLKREDLDKLINDQFSIIETINDISKENEMLVTLSGGFASANIQLNNLGELAEEALDLSLSRGGDQIVINIQGEALKYFGGNAETQEKRTRISSRINAQKLAMLFEESDIVFIMPHHHPDTDGLGSAIGVLKIAQALKKEAYIVLNFNALDKTVKKILTLMEYEYVMFLDNLISVEEALSMATRNSLLTLVDHHSVGQLIDERFLSIIPNKIIIDHHRKLSDSITDTRLSYIEPYASSTTELVVEMMNVFKKDLTLNPFEATILLSGIMVDTNNFMYRTGARTFEAAAVLRKYGADTFKVKTILRESLKTIQTKSKLLTLAEVIKKRFSIVVVPDTIETDRILLAQVADDLLDIDNTVAAFAIGKLDQKTIAISARSIENFNVQAIMEKFGGGGHLNNAGAQVEETPIETVKEHLIEIIENSIQEEKPMKVILKKDLKNKGKKGEVIEVAAGYANYLLTSKQAIEATSENLQAIDDERQKAKDDEKRTLEEAKELKNRIDFRAVKVYVKIGENGKLYGKINTKQIAEALKEQHGIDVDKRKIQLDDPITALGTQEIEIKLHKDVTAKFELLVLEA